MITKVVLAKLSPTMEEGTIVKWNKQEGDAIKVGDVLAEIETDKANMEMEALGAGVVGLELHQRLVGLDLGQHVALAERVALVHQPAADGALLHGVGEPGHHKFFGHESSMRVR